MGRVLRDAAAATGCGGGGGGGKGTRFVQLRGEISHTVKKTIIIIHPPAAAEGFIKISKHELKPDLAAWTY